MAVTAFNCEMDIMFHHTSDGRPELYDFLWEHFAQLIATMQEKKIVLSIKPHFPRSLWAKKTGMAMEEIEHVIQKMSRDKRIKMQADDAMTGSGFTITIPAENVDDVLNAYNIFFEKFLPHLSAEGKTMRVDFSPAPKNAVKCFASSEQKPIINTFLVRNLKQAPRVRSIVFASREERMQKSRGC
ncbi:MAG: hypothetical protein FJY86_02260 [Candidatus Diapherotrites archaeon]|uniref:Uncharacterized protein n=1 Tax=Candidatus Iainarchaeum sp. TaxID=3101447 RepID=A0A8T4C6G6_9ARCH|nr:hypothetical protein [Candidatus Diapherotrites archaeon]